MEKIEKVFSDKDYIKKAKSLLEVSVFLQKNNYYNDSFSRLYYALRSLFRGLCGTPPKGKWKHEALIKCFIDTFGESFLSVEEKKLLRKMPSLRNKIDYEPIEIGKKELNIYRRVTEKIFKRFLDED